MIITIIILVLLIIYSIWAMRKIKLRKKNNNGHCSNCPYKQTGMCNTHTKNLPKKKYSHTQK